MKFNELYFYTATISGWRTIIKDFHLGPLIISSLSYLHSLELIKVYGFVIMPNHIHMIWEMLENTRKESPAASLMKFTAHEFEKVLKRLSPRKLEEFAVDGVGRKYNFWQPKPDLFLLNQVKTIDQKLGYIHMNPMRKKWKLVNNPSDYVYSSARFYETRVKSFNFLYDYHDWVDLSFKQT